MPESRHSHHNIVDTLQLGTHTTESITEAKSRRRVKIYLGHLQACSGRSLV